MIDAVLFNILSFDPSGKFTYAKAARISVPRWCAAHADRRF